MLVLTLSQECILGWPAYPLPRVDQNVLSRLTEYDYVIIGPLFSIASSLKSTLSLSLIIDNLSKPEANLHLNFATNLHVVSAS